MKHTFDLQRFAADNGLAPAVLEVNTTTDAGLSVENKTFYKDLLVDDAAPNLVYNQFGQKATINRKSAEWRKYAALAAVTTALSEGLTPSGQKLTVTSVDAVIAQYGGYVTLSDILTLTAIDPQIAEAVKVLGAQMGLTLDELTRNVLLTGTNIEYAPKIVNGVETAVSAVGDLDATACLSRNAIIRGIRTLRRNNAPTIDGSYVLIIHPDNEADVMMNKDFVEAYKYANEKMLFEGEIGKIGGARVVTTSQVKIDDNGSGLGVYNCLLIGANAYGVVDVAGAQSDVIINQLGSGGSADPLKQRATVGWKATHGCAILNGDYMVNIKCCSENSAAAL